MAIGEFYFAYVDEGVTFDPDVHNVVDEDVFGYKFLHSEGDFAGIDFEIRNPRVGLLNTGRKQWVMFSKHCADDVIRPILYGRIFGVPTDIFEEIVTITVIARPIDYMTQKTVLATALKVEPFWDEIFVRSGKGDDLDAVLESRAAHWYIPPVTHVVSTSSVFVGEDGTINLTESDYFDDSMGLTLNQIPATNIVIKGSVEWDQSFVGSGYDLMPFIMPFFNGSDYPDLIKSFTFKGLQDSWPKPLDNMKGGLVCVTGSLENVSFTAVPQMELPHWLTANEQDPFFDLPLPAPLPKGSIFFSPKITGNWHSGETAGFDISYQQAFLPLGYGVGTLTVGFDVKRSYTENIVINLKTSTQSIVTDPGEDQNIELVINGNKVSDFIDGEVPIGDTGRRKFFDTERGKRAIKYLLCCGRAQLIIKGRAVEITFELPLDDGLEFTLRKNARIVNPRLPGGEAVGKVIKIDHGLNGEDGKEHCQITIGCTIGKGEAPYTAEDGDPVYGSTDYMGADYQQFETVVSLIDPAITELAFTVDNYTANDDGLDPLHLTAADLVVAVDVQNVDTEQYTAIYDVIGTVVDTQEIQSILKDFFTQVGFTFRNVKAGGFETDVTVTVQDLILPKQIDLEAPSA